MFPFLQKARIYGQQANMKAALEEFNKANAVDPKNVVILLLRAEVHQKMGAKDKALADVDKVLEIKPDLPEAMRLRAGLLIEQEKYDDALPLLEKLHSKYPKDPLTMLQLGALYDTQKKFDKAIEIYTDGLSEYPGQWLFLRSRGDVYLNMGKRAESIADYDKAFSQKPDDSGILNNLAWVLATAPEDGLRDGKRAVTLANEACRLTEYKSDFILSTLAAAYAESGDFDSAVKWASKGVEVSTKKNLEEMKKELASYKAHKPWREALPLREDKDAKKPAAAEKSADKAK
jgi:predicted Zn-dependent protease